MTGLDGFYKGKEAVYEKGILLPASLMLMTKAITVVVQVMIWSKPEK